MSQEPMEVSRAEAKLRDMVSSAGIDLSLRPTVAQAWPVFQKFANLPSDAVGPDSDGVLYETGVFNFAGPAEFYVSLVRQLAAGRSDAELDNYYQVHWDFRFPLSPLTSSFSAVTLWRFREDDVQWQEFARLVQSRPEFRALKDVAPLATEIYAAETD